jgi:hypothetical protein
MTGKVNKQCAPADPAEGVKLALDILYRKSTVRSLDVNEPPIPFEHANLATGKWEGATDDDWLIPNFAYGMEKVDALFIWALIQAYLQLAEMPERRR